MKKEKGQAIALVALTILVLALAAFTVINSGVIVWRKIQMMNAADCAALSSTKILARSLNTIANTNNAIGVELVYLPPIIRGNSLMNKDLKSSYEAFREVETGLVRAGSGQSAAVGKEVARLNGADSSKYVGSFSLKLKGRDVTVNWYKLVEIPLVGTVPVPAGRKKYRPAYYRRSWETDEKKAQPTHKISFYVSKNKYAPFGSSLYGGSLKQKETKMNAKAQVFYDCKKSYGFHYGGFPRSRNASTTEKVFIPQPLSMLNPAQFNAYLVPVAAIYQH